MNETPATLHTVDRRPVLRFERRLAHPPEKVWRAITDPAEMAHWFPVDVHTEPRVGAATRFGFAGDHLDLDSPFHDGEVLEFDPPKVYAFRWFDSVLRFELLPEGAGCRLVFTHHLGGAGTWGDRPSTARQATGWDVCLGRLAARLDDRDRPSMRPTWFLARAERYVEAFGLGEGETREHPDGFLLRFERDLTQAPQQVWTTLTETDTGTEAPAVGTAPPAWFDNVPVAPGTVTVVEPPHALEYTWLHDGAPTGRVRLDLRDQQPIGCRLVVAQTVPARLADLRAAALAAWQTHLELLFAALFGEVRPWPAERAEVLRRRYLQRLT